MIIHNLNVPRSLCCPNEAEAPLIVDADAMLPGTIALERLESVSWWYPHEVQSRCCIQLSELAARNRFNFHEAGNAASKMQGLRIAALERLDWHP